MLEHPKQVDNTSVDVAEISIQTDSKSYSEISIQTLETSKLCSSTQTPRIPSKDVKSTQTSLPEQSVKNVTQTPAVDTKAKPKSNWVPSSVPESPMKNSFNIHSLIGSDPFPTVPDALIQGHTSSNKVQISNHSTNHPIQTAKPIQNHPPQVKPSHQASSNDKNHPIANNWQPWSTSGSSTESKNISTSDRTNIKPAVISSSAQNTNQNSVKVGTKRKANHLIEHVVGTQPSSKSAYRPESKDQTSVRAENQVGPSRGIAFPEPKLGVHKLKTSKSAQIWSHVSSSGSNKKPNTNQQLDQRTSRRVEHHKSRQNTNPSSADQRTGTSDRTRQNERTDRSNMDQINFSINSIFADMNTIDDPFTMISQSGQKISKTKSAQISNCFSANQSKRQNAPYNQAVIGAPNQPTMVSFFDFATTISNLFIV